jgi:hypothetical protein
MTAFSPMDRKERDAFGARYMSYLRERDGEPCLQTRTLSRREEVLRRLLASRGPASGPARIDPAVFSRNLARCAPEPGLDRATIWALAVAKGNRAERYGVEHKLDRRGFEAGGAADALTFVEIQECYHTRLLLQVLSLVGLDCDVGAPASALTRAGVRLFGQLPRTVIDVLALAFEVVGIAAFRAMRDEARELFADHPHGRHIDALFAQLLVDEVGHVHFLRSRLGPPALAAARAALPFAKAALFDDNHEVRLLLERRRALDAIETMDIDEVVAGEPDCLPAAEA